MLFYETMYYKFTSNYKIDNDSVNIDSKRVKALRNWTISSHFLRAYFEANAHKIVDERTHVRRGAVVYYLTLLL